MWRVHIAQTHENPSDNNFSKNQTKTKTTLSNNRHTRASNEANQANKLQFANLLRIKHEYGIYI